MTDGPEVTSHSYSDAPPRHSDVLPRAPFASAPSHAQLLDVTLRLHQLTSGDHQEDEMVGVHLHALGELFPGRAAVARLLTDEVPGTLSLLEATGPLRSEVRKHVTLSEAAMRRHGLAIGRGVTRGLEATREPEPQFNWEVDANKGHPLDAPITNGDAILGTLMLESPPGSPPDPDDASILGLLAASLGRSIGQVRLRRESDRLRDRVRMVLDHAHVPVVMLAPNGTVRSASDAILEMMELDREALIGRSFGQFLAEDQKRTVERMLDESLASAGARGDELRIDRKGREPVRLAVTMAAVRDQMRHVEGALLVGQDLTTLRALEAQVRHADKLATIGHMAAGVVHELNNPLTSVSVYADFLVRKFRGTDADGDDLEKLERIRGSAERLLRFSKNLVAYARPSSEPTQPLSAVETLEEAIVFCQHVITERGVRVARRYAEGDHTVMGVRSQLHQVFINLVTNACQAMPEGAGLLTLRTELTESALTVHIADNGPGISAGERERIFEPFVSTKGAGEGTGLGLSIVRNIVTSHHGRIDVAGAIGSGAEFVIELPRLREHAEA